MMRQRVASGLACAVLLLTACGGADRADDGQSMRSMERTDLEDVRELGVRNAAMPLPGLVTAGQLSEEQIPKLVELGFTNFISLRPANENGAGWEEGIEWDEGIVFSRLPIAGASDLTRQNVMALDRLLREDAMEDTDGTVVYADSGDRVGAMLALRAYWLKHAGPEEALDLGRRAGLRGLESQVAALLEAPR